MTQEAGAEFEGLKVNEARVKVVADLEKLGLLEKTEKFTHQVPHCYRCNSTVEPLANLQWFVKMDELAKVAIKAVKNGDVKFFPERWGKVYFDWLENVRDWCISRQLCLGHQIPAWFCLEKQEII